MYSLFRSSTCLVLMLLSNTVMSAQLQISGARIHEAPPAASVLAGYSEITNTSGEAVVTGVFNSPDFARVELHETQIEGDIARMVKQDKLVLEAGETVTLQPGGMHFMFIEPVRKLRAGDRTTLIIRFSDGTEQTQAFEVIKAGAGHDHSHHH
ncbi:MAG: copper chaperone PCu(A)C [Thiotrichales bacterium]|nr:copper chaperone PCu(A)C [Thiotrichales bacterium]